MASQQHASPPASQSSSPTSNATRTPLSLDLSSVPSLVQPSPPSNTLIITNLLSDELFTSPSLAYIRTLLSQPSPLNSFSPLKSLRRIIASYPSTEAAIASTQYLATTPLVTIHNARIYFGEPTPTEESADRHLHAPKSQKLFFISPPPSPPHGWMVRDEGPPNKEVFAGDLAKALEGVRGLGKEQRELDEWQGKEGRKRSGSRSVVYDPQDHGDSLALPAVMVEDTTEDIEVVEEGSENVITHTARPPVELMESA